MTTGHLDTNYLKSIGSGEFAAYLRGHGWAQVKRIGDISEIWTKPYKNGDEFEIMLPLDSTIADYSLRIADALKTLGVEEQRDESQIITDVSTSNSDIVRVRLKHSAIDHGRIPLEYGVQMMTETRNALLAAACLTIDPTARNQIRSPGQATEFINGLKMQTEEGSFVVQIQSEVGFSTQNAAHLTGRETKDGTEPFERRALLRLSESLTTLDKAVVSAGARRDGRPFTNGIPEGVSANLCDAIVGLSIDASAEEVSFQFSWSRTRPVAGATNTTVNFDRKAFPILQEAAKVLRESSPRKEFELIGTVVAHREETTRTGRITICGNIDDKLHNVRMELQGEAYQTALKVIGEQGFIVATGDLVRQSRVYRLTNVRDVSSLELPDPDDLDDSESETSMEYPAGPTEPESAVRDDTDPFADY